jgi:hypothetical protein
MFLSLYGEVINVLRVSLLSHDRYQFDSLILSEQTWEYPRQHLQQLLWCAISVRLNLQGMEVQNSVFDIPPQEEIIFVLSGTEVCVFTYCK